MDVDKALRLLRLPRQVGEHPETGGMILAGIGRYGPYVQHDKTYANLPTVDEVFEVGLNRAVAVLAEKRSGGGRAAPGARGASSAALKELGPPHPITGKPVRVLAGRYGPLHQARGGERQCPQGLRPRPN